MSKSLFLISALLLLAGCRTYVPQAANTSPFITIDGTYDYYIREYYADEDNNRYELKSKQDKTSSANRKLIEVEYLFVSNDGKDNVIYFTTVPDRRQQRYSENYLGRKFVNMFDVRMLHFGKITGPGKDLFVFTGFKPGNQDVWKVNKTNNPETIKIETISETEKSELTQVMVVDSALDASVIFEKENSFQLVYCNTKKTKKEIAVVDKSRIYYSGKQPQEIILYYDKNIVNERNVQRYPKKQIVYDPGTIFK